MVTNPEVIEFVIIRANSWLKFLSAPRLKLHFLITTRVAICATESRDVAQIQRVFEWAVGLVARGALPGVAVAEVDRVLKLAVLYCDRFPSECLFGRYVTDVAFVANNLSVFTEMLAVVAAKTTLSVEVADVVRMRAPVGFHLGKKVCLIDALDLGDGGRDRFGFGCVKLRIGRFVIIRDRFGDRSDGFVRVAVRFC